MANQPTKYKKFVATAATATLVASAIVPVASAASFTDVSETNSHAEAINALVNEGIINGYQDGTFKPTATLTRGHVVKMLGKWVEAQGFAVPADWNTVARFSDLAVDAKDQELVKYAAVVKDAEVFNGSNGALNASGSITRENMALVLDRAYAAVFGQSLVEEAAGLEEITVADMNDAKEEREARAAIQALSNLEITKTPDKMFKPKDAVNRAQFASFLYRTIEVAGKTTPDQGEVTIASLKASKVNELTVEFNKAVTDTEAAKFAVKQGTTDVKVSDVKWNEAKTVATVEVDHKFVAATYNLTVTGVAEEALTASVTTTREVATEMKFNSDKLVLTGVEDEANELVEARITYEVYNQYGEIITDTISTSALEADLKGIGSDDDKTQYNVRNGLLVFWVDEDEDEGEAGSIKLTYEQGDIELETTQEITLSDEIEPGQVEIKGVHSDAGYDFTSANVEKALSSSERSDWTEEFVVLFTLKDQYGVEINAEDASNSTSGDVALLESVQDGLRLSTSDDDIFELDEDEITTKVVDGKYYFAAKMRFTFDGELVEETGENTVTFRSTATGDEAVSKINLASSERVQAVELSYPTGVVAGNEDIYVPVKALDNEGNTVVDAALLNSLVNDNELIVKIDGKERTAADGTNFYFVEKDGATFLKFKSKKAIDMNSAGKNEEYELDIEIEVDKTGEESEITLDVQPDAYPRSLVKVSAETAVYLNDVSTGDTITLALEQGDFTIEDQYGRGFDDALAGDFKIEASVKGGTNFNLVSNKIETFNDEIVLGTTKKGSSNIEFLLTGTNIDEDGDAEPVTDKLSVTFRTVDEKDFVSYKVDSKEFVFGHKEGSATKSPKSKVEVFGVLGNGQEIQLPANAFRVATGNYLFPENNTTGDAAYIFVNPEGLGQLENVSGTNQLETGFNVIINQSGEVIQTAVKISDGPSKVKSIKLEDNFSAADNALETISFDLTASYNVVDESTITYAELINALATEVKFEIKDQYGYNFVNGSDVTDLLAKELKVTETQVNPVTDVSRPVITLSEISNDDANVRSNGSGDVEIQNVAQGDSFTATLTINGVSKSVKVFAE